MLFLSHFARWIVPSGVLIYVYRRQRVAGHALLVLPLRLAVLASREHQSAALMATPAFLLADILIAARVDEVWRLQAQVASA